MMKILFVSLLVVVAIFIWIEFNKEDIFVAECLDINGTILMTEDGPICVVN